MPQATFIKRSRRRVRWTVSRRPARRTSRRSRTARTGRESGRAHSVLLRQSARTALPSMRRGVLW
jgi:hypothetical protein